jgi:hypothetical protein
MAKRQVESTKDVSAMMVAFSVSFPPIKEVTTKVVPAPANPPSMLCLRLHLNFPVHGGAKNALLSTRGRPVEHHVRCAGLITCTTMN